MSKHLQYTDESHLKVCQLAAPSKITPGDKKCQELRKSHLTCLRCFGRKA